MKLFYKRANWTFLAIFFPPGRWEVFLLDFITLGTDGWVGLRTTFRLEFILSYLA